MIIRVTATEFETADGTVCPHPVPFDPEDVPTVEEFQGWYDKWYTVFQQQGLIPPASHAEGEDA